MKALLNVALKIGIEWNRRIRWRLVLTAPSGEVQGQE